MPLLFSSNGIHSIADAILQYNYIIDKAGGTNILLVRLVAIAFAVLNMVILKITCQTCMLSQNIGQAMAWLAWVVPPAMIVVWTNSPKILNHHTYLETSYWL